MTKSLLAIAVRLLSIALLTLIAGFALSTSSSAEVKLPERLRVSENARYLVTERGEPVFVLCDTAWSLSMRLRREEVDEYLAERKRQRFNAITFVFFNPGTSADAYSHAPFGHTGGRFNPAEPITTPGNNPSNSTEYDYWDHVDYVVNAAARHGLYIIALPTWGSAVVGTNGGKPTDDIVFNLTNAYTYGRWLGARYSGESHLIWMTGGDRSAVYDNADHRPVFRAMAEGIADGARGENQQDGKADYRGLLMSYHPQKNSPQSSEWFHDDAWLSFNSIQHWPEQLVLAIAHDLNLKTAKPTWVFEPRYEAYWKKPYKEEDWGEWQMRFQAYQSVFAGGFGFTYGHERVFGFGKDGADWRKHLAAPGALQMQHLVRLMTAWTRNQFLNRIPDQELIDGDTGKAERLISDRLTVTRGRDGGYALVYSAMGRNIRVKMNRLNGPKVDAFWFNPRNGRWRVDGEEGDPMKPFKTKIVAGANAGAVEFDPPGEARYGNDWVLVLR